MPNNKRKKETASTIACISTMKVRKSVNANNLGSFTQDQQSSTSIGKQLNSSGNNPSSVEPTNGAIMAIPTDIVESNRSLAGQTEKLETQGSTTSFPIGPRSHCYNLTQNSTTYITTSPAPGPSDRISGSASIYPCFMQATT